METSKGNAPRQRGAGDTYQSTAGRIVAKSRRNLKLDACLASLRLTQREAELVFDCIAYIRSLKLNRWHSAHDAVSHALEVLNRLGFAVGCNYGRR